MFYKNNVFSKTQKLHLNSFLLISIVMFFTYIINIDNCQQKNKHIYSFYKKLRMTDSIV